MTIEESAPKLSQQISPVDGKPFDLVIYQEQRPLDNGYVPHVRRRYRYVGESRGQKCNFECEIEKRHPTLPGYFKIRAIFAMNVMFEPHDWTHARDIVQA